MQDNRDAHKSQAELITELAALRARLTEIEARDADHQRAVLVEAEQKLRYLQTLRRITATLRSARPLQDVLETIVHGAVQALDYIGAMIALPNDAGTSLRVGAVAGGRQLDATFAATGLALEALYLPLTVGDNPLVHTYASGELLTWPGAPERVVSGVEPVSPQLALLLRELTSSKLSICVPLPSATRTIKTVGVLVAFSVRGRLSKEEQAMLLGLADQAGLAVETARRSEDTAQLQAFNESIVQSMAEGIAVQDAQGNLIFVNPAMATMLGYTPGELVGRYGPDLIPPDQRPTILAADQRRFRGQSDRYEIELLRRDGTRLPVMISGSPRFDAAGHFTGTLAVFSDISERVRVEAATARRAQEMASLYETFLDLSSQPSVDVEFSLHLVVERVVNLLGARMGSLYLLRPATHGRPAPVLELVVAYNLPGDYIGATLNIGEGVAGRVTQTGQPMMVADHTQWEGRSVLFGDAPFRRVLAVPLKVQDRVIGIIEITDDQAAGLFSDDEVWLVSLFADKAAIALENARLYQEAQQRLKELQSLFDASAAISGSLDLERVLLNGAQQMTALLGVEGCAISTWDRARDVLINQLDYSPEGADPPGKIYRLDDYPASRRVLQQRQPVAVRFDDPKADHSELFLMTEQSMRSLLMVPLVVRDEVIGLLELYESVRDREFTATEISVCQTLANQTAAALENARLFEAEHKQRTLAEALRRATAAVGSSLELDQVLDQILDQVSTVLAADAHSIMLIEGDDARFVRWRGYDRLAAVGTWPIAISVADTPSFCAMRDSGRPLIVPDTAAYPGWVRFPETAWIRSHAGAPIQVRGEVVGFLLASSASPGFFDPSHAGPLQAFADSASLAVENARLYEETVRRNRELALLNRVVAASAASQEIEPILEMVCRELVPALDLAIAGASVIDETKGEAAIVAEYMSPHLAAAFGDHASHVLEVMSSIKSMTFPLDREPFMRALLEKGTPVSIAVADDRLPVGGDLPSSGDQRPDLGERLSLPEYLAPVRDLMRQIGVASAVFLPLIVDGKTVGSLGMGVARPDGLSAEQMDLASRVAGQVSGALARARLAKAQQRLTIAVEQAAESVLITDTHGTIQYVNPAFERVTGYDRFEVIGRNPRLLKSGKQDPAFYQHLWQTITSDLVWNGRLINRKKDGSLYTEDVTISPVHNQAGETVSYVAVKHDVSHVVQLEEQFRQSQKMEAMGRLAGGIAHDFNNLLTVIQVSAWLLQRQIRTEDPRWEYVQRIQDTVERATNLIKQLLSFSRRQIIEPQTLNLNRVVGDLSRMLQRIIGEDIELATSLAPDLWPVRVDPSQMEQVIMNLAVNARDAMADGGTLTIETANVVLDEAYAAYHVGAQPGEHVLLAISDTGMGMDEEVRAHIFEPFFTTKQRGQGTGLGLSTVFGIINQHEGYIWVYSEVGKGTTFKVYFPRAEEAEFQEPVRSIPLVEDGQGTESILIVEDEAAVRELIVRVLKAHGYQVLEARDGPEALQISEQHDGPIDLLLTDVIMPHMNGKELHERLRGPRPEMRVLFISGYTDNAIAHHGVLEPGTRLLPKPFSMEDLIRTVRSVLAGRQE
jgi:PAS domain S-box-containing protein